MFGLPYEIEERLQHQQPTFDSEGMSNKHSMPMDKDARSSAISESESVLTPRHLALRNSKSKVGSSPTQSMSPTSNATLHTSERKFITADSIQVMIHRLAAVEGMKP